MNARDKCADVIKSEIESSEHMVELISDHEKEEIEESCIDVCNDLMEATDNTRRIKVMFTTALQIGRAIESETLVEFGAKGLKKFEDG